MIANKYVQATIVTLVISAVTIVVRENIGERYFSCVGQQVKVLEDENLMFNSYTTLNLEAGGKGKVQFQGYLNKDNTRWKIDRVMDITFSPQGNKTSYLFEMHNVVKSPDDLAPDDLLNKLSDIHSGKALFGVKMQGKNALVIGDSLQPRLVCIRR